MLSVAQGFGMVPLALRAALWSRDPPQSNPEGFMAAAAGVGCSLPTERGAKAMLHIHVHPWE